ncbi:hypothetical protein BS78_K130300 [Paspalum vaginatum]|uniref:Uncharacterized protein n=1 Tax=Paspalum vaginatum TaxID=158149 RepID=A0A9W7XEV5_9POAL|nr:hypothetical protein BS78_K130300 [Paspalum vaginatum]
MRDEFESTIPVTAAAQEFVEIFTDYLDRPVQFERSSSSYLEIQFFLAFRAGASPLQLPGKFYRGFFLAFPVGVVSPAPATIGNIAGRYSFSQ